MNQGSQLGKIDVPPSLRIPRLLDGEIREWLERSGCFLSHQSLPLPHQDVARLTLQGLAKPIKDLQANHGGTGFYPGRRDHQPRLYRDDSVLGAGLRQPLLHGSEHVFGVGPAGAEEARQHVAAARGDGLAVDHHVELAGLPDVERDVDIEAFLDEGGEPRRPGLVASSRAVEDLDLHVVSIIGISIGPAKVALGGT